jgi:hypothetical protein
MLFKTVRLRHILRAPTATRAAVLIAAIIAGAGSWAHAQTVDLGEAASFAVLGGSLVTNTGPTRIVGNVGVSPGSSITGTPPSVVTGGSLHVNDALAVQAHADAQIAYNTLAGMTATTVLTGEDLGSRTLPPGVYSFSTSAQLTGQLILDGQGAVNPLFVFQIGSTLTTASGSSIVLVDGAVASNVFFQVGSSATLGTGTSFSGTIIAAASDTLTTGASVNGRIICLDGAVTLDSNNISAHPPTSQITGVSVVAGGADMRVTVRYTDNAAIKLASLDSGDVELRRAGGSVTSATLVSRTLNSTTTATGVYRFAAPGGAWDSSDNGVYSVWVRPLQVEDMDGSYAPTQMLRAYSLWFNGPSATVTNTGVINGGTHMDVAVLYRDYAGSPLGIAPGTVGNGDVELTGPSGFVAEGRLIILSTPQAGQVLATYRFPARNGYWDWSDNGVYNVRVRPNQVLDLQGNPVAAQSIKTYSLFFLAPEARVSSTSILAGGDHINVAVTYRAHNRYMGWGSFTSGDLELVGPGGYGGASTMLSRTYNSATNSYVVTYRFPARTGTWDAADNGRYSLRVKSGEVWDAIGNLVPAVEIRSYGLWFPPGRGVNCGSIDFDGDGDVATDADIEAFFACMAGNCCHTCGSPDFNQDGESGTDADIESFFRVLAGGAC